MKSRQLWKYALLVLGTLSTVVPPSLVTATDRTIVATRATNQSSADSGKAEAVEVHDVSLGIAGELTGYILDGQGKAVAGSRVIVGLGRNSVAESTTDASGRFRIDGLRGGVYQIVHADGVSVVRVWKNGTAPKNAKNNALIVAGKRQVRGQSEAGLLSLTQPGVLVVGGVAIAGTTLAIVGMAQASDANDDADAATAKFDALVSSIN